MFDIRVSHHVVVVGVNRLFQASWASQPMWCLLDYGISP